MVLYNNAHSSDERLMKAVRAIVTGKKGYSGDVRLDTVRSGLFLTQGASNLSFELCQKSVNNNDPDLSSLNKLVEPNDVFYISRIRPIFRKVFFNDPANMKQFEANSVGYSYPDKNAFKGVPTTITPGIYAATEAGSLESFFHATASLESGTDVRLSNYPLLSMLDVPVTQSSLTTRNSDQTTGHHLLYGSYIHGGNSNNFKVTMKKNADMRLVIGDIAGAQASTVYNSVKNVNVIEFVFDGVVAKNLAASLTNAELDELIALMREQLMNAQMRAR
jgi:hypothetical protein